MPAMVGSGADRKPVEEIHFRGGHPNKVDAWRSSWLDAANLRMAPPCDCCK